jgi:hypothetical protein
MPKLFVGLSAILILIVTVWTFQFSLATQLALSNADAQASRAFAAISVGPNAGSQVGRGSCRYVRTGGIGPLKAPYQQCATSSAEGTFIVFSASGRGLGYTDIGAGAFPDKCVRHITGRWWMFVGSAGLGDCPVGYGFRGGG